MTDEELIDQNNNDIREIKEILKQKQVSPTDMLQQMVDETNSCESLVRNYIGTNLDFLSGLDTSNVQSMYNMFRECKNLKSVDLSNLNVVNLQVTDSMFYGCSALPIVNLSNWDTKSLGSMRHMFRSCSSLTEVDLSNFNTSQVYYMEQMFAYCKKLINIKGVLNMENIYNATDMFNNCTALTDVTLKNIKISLVIGSGTSYGTKLSNDTLINTIQELWDLTGKTSQTLTLSTTSKNNIANICVKLITPTAEQIEADPYINNKKPCEVCEPTDDGAMLITEYLTSKNWALA